MKKFVYAAFKDVINIIRNDDETEVDGPGEPNLLGLYTHLEQANRETADQALDAFAPANSKRIDDITKRRTKELELKELVKELSEHEKPYTEEMRLSDNKKVQFFVVKRPLIGPRNIWGSKKFDIENPNSHHCSKIDVVIQAEQNVSRRDRRW